MSNDTGHPDPETIADEQLVAYLDGELDDESSRRVEALLVSDAKLRRQLGEMERTWDALDQLGRFEVDERFTQTTLEMVALAAEEEVQQQKEEAPRQSRRRWILGAAGLATAGVAGFLAVAIFWPDPNRRLLEEKPVLEHLEQYRQIDDIDFLRRLYRENLFGETENGE